MAMDNQTIQRKIQTIIQENTKGFTGRAWVFQAIDKWLADPNGAHIFLLQGEPGSGKTAIASRLAQLSLSEDKILTPAQTEHLYAHFLSAIHFCSASGERSDIIPLNFIKSLSTQLLFHYSSSYSIPLLEKAGINITVNQIVGEGSPTAIAINQLNVNIDNSTNAEDAFDSCLLEPLKDLSLANPSKPIIFLIDGLDEAVSYSGQINIVSLLKRINDLPKTIRFICTSRSEDERVKNFLQETSVFYFSAREYDAYNNQDILQYVTYRFNDEKELNDRITKIEEKQRSTLFKTIVQKAAGNFLYVRFLLDAISRGQQTLRHLKDLPEGLDKLYFRYLERVVAPGDSLWDKEYAPFLRVLIAAQEDMTEKQLQAFTGADEYEVDKCYQRLQQFVERIKKNESQTDPTHHHRLYHSSFIDFLQKKALNDGTNNRFYLSSHDSHRLMAKRCAQEKLDIIWKDSKRDDIEQERRMYARKYYVLHLYQSGPRDWDTLCEVLTDGSYGKAKLQYDPSARSYTRDLDLGRQALLSDQYDFDESIESLPQLWRYSLLYCNLISKADQFPPEAFRLLMLLHHQQDKIYGLAELITRPLNKVEALLAIADPTSEEDEQDKLFRRIVEIIEAIEDTSEQALARQRLGQILANVQQNEKIQIITDLIEDTDKRDHLVYSICETLIRRQQIEQAERLFPLIQEKKGWLAQAYYNVVLQCLEKSQWETAYNAISNTYGTRFYITGLCKLIEALISTREEANKQQAQTTLESIEQHILMLDVPERIEASLTLVETLEHIGSTEDMQKVLHQIKEDLRTVNHFSDERLLHCQWLVKTKQLEQMKQFINRRIKGKKLRSKAREIQIRALIEEQRWNLLQEQIPPSSYGELQLVVVTKIIEELAKKHLWMQADDILSRLEKNVILEARYIIACEQSRAHLWEQAQSSIKQLTDPNIASAAWYVLAQELILAHQWESVEQCIERLSVRNKIKALCSLGVEYAQIQQIKQAELIWNRIEAMLGTVQERHVYQKALATLSLVPTQNPAACIEMSHTDELDQAKITHLIYLSKQISSTEVRSRLLKELAGVLAKRHDWNNVQSVLEEIQHNRRKVEALIEIGKARFLAVDEEHAISQIVQDIETVIETTQDTKLKDSFRIDLVDLLAQAKDWEHASSSVKSISGKVEKTQALGRLAIARKHIQQDEEGEQAWNEAETLISRVTDVAERDELRCSLARLMAQYQDWYHTYAMISLIEQKDIKVSALSKLGESFMLAQRPLEASQAWNAAKECINALQGKDTALRALSSALIHSQQWQDAREAIDEINSPILKTRALAELGSSLWQSNEQKQAEIVWLDAEEGILSILDINERLRIYAELGGGMARAQAWEHAETIWREIQEQQDIVLTQQEVEMQDQHTLQEEEPSIKSKPKKSKPKRSSSAAKSKRVAPLSKKLEADTPITSEKPKPKSRGKRGGRRKKKSAQSNAVQSGALQTASEKTKAVVSS